MNKVEVVLTGNSIDGAEGISKQELAYKKHYSRLGAEKNRDEAGDEDQSYLNQDNIFICGVMWSALSL